MMEVHLEPVFISSNTSREDYWYVLVHTPFPYPRTRGLLPDSPSRHDPG